MSDSSDKERAEVIEWLLSLRARTAAAGTLPAAAYGAPPVAATPSHDVVLEAVPAGARAGVVRWLRLRRPDVTLAEALALVTNAPNAVLLGVDDNDAVVAVGELIALGASARLR